MIRRSFGVMRLQLYMARGVVASVSGVRYTSGTTSPVVVIGGRGTQNSCSGAAFRTIIKGLVMSGPKRQLLKRR